MPYYFGLDSSILWLLPAFLIGLLAQWRVNSVYRKYSQVASRNGWTGANMARDMLLRNHLNDVDVRAINGSLSDHFDPRNNSLALSQAVHSQTSVAALGVAAHEVGHAMQYESGYSPVRLRGAVAPVAQITSQLAWPLFLIGLLMSAPLLLDIGIVLYAFAVSFQLITLPVEFNASARALDALEAGGYLERDEIPGAKKVLNAAAMTYVAATLMSVAQLMRLLSLSGRGRRRG